MLLRFNLHKHWVYLLEQGHASAAWADVFLGRIL